MPEIKISGYNISVPEDLYKYLQEKFKIGIDSPALWLLKYQKYSGDSHDVIWNDCEKGLLGIVGVSESGKSCRTFWEYSLKDRVVRMKDPEDYYNLSKHFFLIQQLEASALEPSEKIWGVDLDFFSKKIIDRIFCEFCLKNSSKVKISAEEFSDYIWVFCCKVKM